MSSSLHLDDYLTAVPRGLQDIVQDLLCKQIQLESSDNNVIVQNIEVIGEDPIHYNAAHLQDLQDRLVKASAKKIAKQRAKRPRLESVADTNLMRVSAGAVYDQRTSRHTGVGYDDQTYSWPASSSSSSITPSEVAASSTNEKCLWSIPGANVGTVWMRFSTNANPNAIASCRCLGPLLALVKFYTPVPGTDVTSTMDCVVQDLQNNMAHIDWQHPLTLWKRHLRPQCNINDDEIRYRCSCVRDESKDYPYARHDLLHQAAKFLAPQNCDKWNVDLDHFDLEIVWFWRPHASAVAISLRDYTSAGAISFSRGLALPPDISPPYLQAEKLSDLIRLRPSTAQALLQMADLQQGDVVVDPCVGIGTIVLECLHLREPNFVVAMGGDLELDESLRAAAADYARQTRQWLKSQNRLTCSVASLLASDATALPLGPASVDAIVSDLPFGRSCLSAKRLNELVPLMVAEWARILRPSTGRMVLLCGNHQVLLEALHQANQKAMSDDDDNDDNDNDTGNASFLWELPVKTCRPVNIGGNLSWILGVRRGPRLKSVRSGRTSKEALYRYHARLEKHYSRNSKPQR